MFINNYGETNGEFAKLMFGSHNVAAPPIKQAIVVKRVSDYGVGDMQFWVDSNADANDAVEADAKLTITQAGLGRSQFTAKAWANYNHYGAAIRDSHNISSITDVSSGVASYNFDVDMANVNFTAFASSSGTSTGASTNSWADLNDNSPAVYMYAVGSFRTAAYRTSYRDFDWISIIAFGD